MPRLPLAACLLSLLPLSACMSTDSGSDSESRVTHTIHREGFVDLLEENEDSLGLGMDLGPQFPARDRDTTRAPGAIGIHFEGDSVYITYYVTGSKEAWVPLGLMEDSLMAEENPDSARVSRHIDSTDAFVARYLRIKAYPRSACTVKALPGVATVTGDDAQERSVTLKVKLDAHADGFRLVIDPKTSLPTGISWGNLRTSPAVFSYQTICPDPNS